MSKTETVNRPKHPNIPALTPHPGRVWTSGYSLRALAKDFLNEDLCSSTKRLIQQEITRITTEHYMQTGEWLTPTFESWDSEKHESSLAELLQDAMESNN